MPSTVFRNARLEVNGTDISGYVKDVTLSYSADSLEVTTMGADTHLKKGGLFNWTVDASLVHDAGAASVVDALMFPLVGVSTCVELRPTNTCSTAINPRFYGIGVLTQYPPMGGGVGTILETKIHWDAAGTLGRSTTAT